MKITKKALIIILVSVLTPILAFSAFAGTTYALYKADKKPSLFCPACSQAAYMMWRQEKEFGTHSATRKLILRHHGPNGKH